VSRQGLSTSSAPRVPTFFGHRYPFYYGWVIVGVALVAEFMASGMGGLTISLFYRPIHDDLGWSLTLFTGAATASTLAGTAVTPFLGGLLDRLGARPVMLWGAVAAGFGLIALSQIREVWQFWVLYAFVGALGLHELGSFSGPVVVTKWFVRKRGRAMAISSYGTTLAGVLMTPVIGFLITGIGWRGAWFVLGLVLLAVMVPLIAVFMRRSPEDLGLLPDGDSPDAAAQAGAGRARAREEQSWTFKEAVRTRTLWVLVLSMNLMSFCASVQVFHGITYLTQQQGLSVAAASLITTVRWLGVTACRAPWGFIVERVPMRYCLAGCYLIKASCLLWLIILPYPVNIVGYLIAFALGGAQALVQPMAWANYYGRGSQGTIQGMLRPLLAVPSLIGPLLVAALFDRAGSFNVAFLIASALGMSAGLLALSATPPTKRTTPAAAS
jgi:MFS family permease